MPRKDAKATRSKRTKTPSKTKPKLKHTSKTSKHYQPSIFINANRLENLLNNISNNRRELTKSDINLPARLMQNGNKSSNPQSKPLIVSKSISSSYAATMQNGEVHTAGKEVINDSTKPYIQVSELHNGHLGKYMIPRNQSSQYKLFSNPTNTMHKMKKYKKTKKTKKTKTPKKTKKTRKS